MIRKVAVGMGVMEIPPRYSEFRRVVKVFFGRKLAAFGFALIILLIITAIFSLQLAPYDPYKIDISQKLLQPSQVHLLGTDALGRDTLSRIIYGSRASLMVGIIAVGMASLIGQSLGLMAAYFGGTVYAMIMRFIDALMAVPMILNALIIATVLGGGLKNVIIALGIGMIAPQARIMCGQALSVMQNDYVLAGRAMGVSNIRMMLRHIVPNAFPPLIVLITLEIGTCILAEASLSFLGIGIAPPMPTWGSMVNDGYKYLLIHPILSFSAGFAIMLVVFAFNMVGDGLRDALDPRLRGTL